MMAEYEQTMARIRRESETEQRVRAMDVVDIVEEILRLEDDIDRLQEMVEIYETTDAARSFTDEHASRMYQLVNSDRK